MTDDSTPLDQSLRDALENYAPTPSAQLWEGLAGRLAALPPEPGPPPPRRRWPVPLPWLLAFTAFVGGLGGWLLPHPGGPAGAVSAPAPARPAAPAPPYQRLATARALETTAREHLPTRQSGVAGAAKLPPAPAPAAAWQQPARIAGGLTGRKQPFAALPGATRSGGETAGPRTALPLAVALRPDTARQQPARPKAVAAEAATAEAVAAAPSPSPATLRVLIALEHRTLDQLPALPAPDTAARRALARTLRAEHHELLHLQRRTDSLLLALGETLPAALAAAAQPQPDTTTQALSTKHQAPKWSLLLTAAPEQNYLGLASALRDEATNLRRNQETGRFGLAAALTAEYQLRPRLSLGAGLGYTRVGAELRQALRLTDYTVRYDTTLTTTQTGYTTVSNTYAIRIIQIAQLSPVFNASGQVLRYDTVYVPRNDTLRSTVIAHDTIRSTRRVVTPLLQRYERTSYQTLRPDYHFLTLPLLVRYRLSVPGRARVWADVSAGAQLQFFLGGSQLVSTDGGTTFRTERVGVADGPFRPFNLALSGAVALNYALTDRVSLSLAPTLRWQTLSVFRPETGLRQQATSTGLQVGVRFKL